MMCRLIRRSALPAFDFKLPTTPLKGVRYVRRTVSGGKCPNKSGDNLTREVVAAVLLN